MTTSYKEKSIALVTSLEKEIAAMAIASEPKQNALKTIQEFLDLRHSKEEGETVVASKLRRFVIVFGRHLMPGGIVLSKEGSEVWHQIQALNSSSETTSKIHPFAFKG
ncbi:hypothetical protein [Streptococcus pacificus]|uniref:Uncharacterized protein n=1 Tax=Streptococcus pacificus TaxID=2740577 RepID=A0ABS0ZJD2_9STRE|nr:hypothetical protein [Streptococcus pacificus]MBJ8326054.1 hypothetical protein [Streptococcus pacificus]